MASAPASAAAPSVSTEPYAGTSYPSTAIDCAAKPAGYTGEFSSIKAVDRYTVVFELCAPDVAFLSNYGPLEMGEMKVTVERVDAASPQR